MQYDINDLLESHRLNPNDETLLSKIALHYINHIDDKKDLDYLNKAYQTKTTAFTINNYAHHLTVEYGEQEKALEIIKCIDEIPINSFYPYATYAQILFSTGQIDNPNNISQQSHHKIIELSQIALNKFNNLPTEYQYNQFDKKIFLKNNIIVSQIMTGQFDTVHKLFNEIYQDIEFAHKHLSSFHDSNDIYEWHDKILLNHIYFYLSEGNRSNVYRLLALIKQRDNIDDLDIAYVYSLLNDDKSCFELIGLNDPDVFDVNNLNISFDAIWYLIYQHYPTLWLSKIKHEIQTNINWLDEEKRNFNSNWQKSDINNHKDILAFYQGAINHYRRFLTQGKPDKPNTDIKKLLNYFWSCYLFGCSLHHNLPNDDI